MTFEESWVPAARVARLLDHDMRGSLYALMHDDFGCPPMRATDRESLQKRAGACKEPANTSLLGAEGCKRRHA